MAKIGGYNNGINFHVAASVSLDMMAIFPQMRDYGWSNDCALVIPRKTFEFLIQGTFEPPKRSHGIRALCAKMSVTIPLNEEVYVSVEIKGNAGVDVLMFEPDLAYIQKYRAYPCPDLVGMAQPTPLRLLNADPIVPLTVYMGTVMARASPVLPVSERFVRVMMPVDPPLRL